MNIKSYALTAFILISTHGANGTPARSLKEIKTFNDAGANEGFAWLWSPDGKKFAIARSGKPPYQIEVYDTKTWQLTNSFIGTLLAFSPDSRTICLRSFSKSGHGKVKTYALKTQHELQSFSGYSAIFVKGCNKVLVLDGDAIKVKVYNITNGHEYPSNIYDFYMQHISPDGRKVISRRNGNLLVSEALTQKTLFKCASRNILSGYPHLDVAYFSPNSSMLFVIMSNKEYAPYMSKTVVYRISDGKQIGIFDGSTLHSSNTYISVKKVDKYGNYTSIIYNLATGKRQCSLPGYLECFSPDNSKALVCKKLGAPGEIGIYDTACGQLLYTYNAPKWHKVEFSPDGSQMVINDDHTGTKIFEMC